MEILLLSTIMTIMIVYNNIVVHLHLVIGYAIVRIHDLRLPGAF